MHLSEGIIEHFIQEAEELKKCMEELGEEECPKQKD